MFSHPLGSVVMIKGAYNFRFRVSGGLLLMISLRLPKALYPDHIPLLTTLLLFSCMNWHDVYSSAMSSLSLPVIITRLLYWLNTVLPSFTVIFVLPFFVNR